MPSSQVKTLPSKDLQLFFLNIPPAVLLQIGTGTVLVAILGSKAIGETLQALGQASEEIFRGDRLPLLKFPEQTEIESGKDT